MIFWGSISKDAFSVMVSAMPHLSRLFQVCHSYSLLLFSFFVSVSGIAMMMINHILPIHGEI
jgi:hypothetical protein